MTKYSIGTIRKKAREAGFEIHKGFRHYHNGGVLRNWRGEAFTGYEVIDLSTGYAVWGSYDEYYDHTWSLEEVENFLMEEYDKAGLVY